MVIIVCKKLFFAIKNVTKTVTQVPIVDLTHKSDNIQYNTLGPWDKPLMDQASDVPSFIIFHNFLQNSLQKLFQFFFWFFYKDKSRVLSTVSL